MDKDKTFGYYKSILRPLLFRLNPETAHHLTVQACRLAGRLPGVGKLTQKSFGFASDELKVEVAGLSFPNPIGLAAGWDKNGVAVRLLDRLGFGFNEIGSISAEASSGNPKPRLFRAADDRAVVVNYGLPNDGAAIISRRLAKYRVQVPLGVNVVTTNYGPMGKARTAEQIFDDYATSVSLVQDHASYLTLNLSCPNASDGKDFFAQPGHIEQLLSRLDECQITIPVFLKLPPIDSSREHDRWLAESDEFAFVRGFMFNLAPGKPDWLTFQSRAPKVVGAVAGAPVSAQMNRCISGLYRRMDQQRFAIIGGGGVFTGDDAWQKIRLGASLIQVYTALIYCGPGVVRSINEGLLAKMQQHGFRQLSEAVGTGLA